MHQRSRVSLTWASEANSEVTERASSFFASMVRPTFVQMLIKGILIVVQHTPLKSELVRALQRRTTTNLQCNHAYHFILRAVGLMVGLESLFTHENQITRDSGGCVSKLSCHGLMQKASATEQTLLMAYLLISL